MNTPEIFSRVGTTCSNCFLSSFFALVNFQVNALLCSLDIDSNGPAKGPIHARLRELDDYWNESQGIIKPLHPTDGWVAEFGQHRIEHGDPDAWAHSFERQHGANGWASEFQQVRSH